MERSYTVTGGWPFPTDMLRHDSARAAMPEDQVLIDRISGEYPDDEFGVGVEVSINLVMDSGDPTRARPNGHWLPNAARWESFGWWVSGVPEVDDARLTIKSDRRVDEVRRSALAKLTDEERRVLGV